MINIWTAPVIINTSHVCDVGDVLEIGYSVRPPDIYTLTLSVEFVASGYKDMQQYWRRGRDPHECPMHATHENVQLRNYSE